MVFLVARNGNHSFRIFVTVASRLHLSSRMPSRALEIELARRMKTGDEGAFDQFATIFGARLFQYSLVLCRQREDAEDVVQDTLMALRQKLPELRDAESVRAWAFRIAKNNCLMQRRKSVFEPERCYKFPEPTDSLSTSALDLLVSLREILRELPHDLRMVFLLREVEKLTTAETAHALEITEDTVKSRLRRARSEIRFRLGGAGVR